MLNQSHTAGRGGGQCEGGGGGGGVVKLANARVKDMHAVGSAGSGACVHNGNATGHLFNLT